MTDIDVTSIAAEDVRFAALAFAAVKHHGQTYYEGEPFLIHLFDVGAVAEDFGLGSDDFIAACLLHDVVEDTDATVEEVTQLFGAEVGGLVDGVTDVTGPHGEELPRVERRRLTRAKTKLNRRAVALKLCDRIANTRAGIAQIDTDPATAWHYLDKYIEEFPAFFEDLYAEGEHERLWEELSNLQEFLLAQRAA